MSKTVGRGGGTSELSIYPVFKLWLLVTRYSEVLLGLILLSESLTRYKLNTNSVESGDVRRLLNS